MKSLISVLLGLTVTSVGMASAQTTVVSPATVQVAQDLNDLSKAKNLARQAAEQANGGLQEYQAGDAMHGPALEAPYIETPNAWRFTIQGGRPGFEIPSIETVVRVEKGSFDTTVIDNQRI